MLTEKYNNYIFYVHNLGKFDVIFLYLILLDSNEKQNIILFPLYRDNQIIRIIVKLNYNKKKIFCRFLKSIK
jgi:hypothetical protein